MNIEYKSQKELYQSLIPAFKVKKRIMQNKNYLYIKNEDIWSYLALTKWKKSIGLTLSEMISDIINVSEESIDKYIKKKIKEENKKIV